MFKLTEGRKSLLKSAPLIPAVLFVATGALATIDPAAFAAVFGGTVAAMYAYWTLCWTRNG